MNTATLATARRAALLEPLTRAELVQLGRILTRAARRAGEMSGHSDEHSHHPGPCYPAWASDYDATAADVTDILSDDVLGMLLNA